MNQNFSRYVSEWYSFHYLSDCLSGCWLRGRSSIFKFRESNDLDKQETAASQNYLLLYSRLTNFEDENSITEYSQIISCSLLSLILGGSNKTEWSGNYSSFINAGESFQDTLL